MRPRRDQERPDIVGYDEISSVHVCAGPAGAVQCLCAPRADALRDIWRVAGAVCQLDHERDQLAVASNLLDLCLRRGEVFATGDWVRLRREAVAVFAPDDIDAKNALADYLIESDQFPLALRTAQRYQLLQPDDVENYLLVARIYEAWGRTDEARRTLERTAAAFPDSESAKRALNEIS